MFIRACLQTLFVILNEVKNPSGVGERFMGSEHPTGFFAALRMTGFGDLKGLKTRPGPTLGLQPIPGLRQATPLRSTTWIHRAAASGQRPFLLFGVDSGSGRAKGFRGPLVIPHESDRPPPPPAHCRPARHRRVYWLVHLVPDADRTGRGAPPHAGRDCAGRATDDGPGIGLSSSCAGGSPGLA